MRKLLLLICLLEGCSAATQPQPVKISPAPEPVYKLKGYDGPVAMDNNELVQASKQCLYARLKPNVQYVSVKIDTGGKTLVPVSVLCEAY
jgi:hypothetical protein